MAVGLTASLMFLNLNEGQRILAKLKSGNARQGSMLSSVFGYYYSTVS